ncbi:MAG: glycosyltransferase family 9 protein [Alphaproteobacteria bacterium]
MTQNPISVTGGPSANNDGGARRYRMQGVVFAAFDKVLSFFIDARGSAKIPEKPKNILVINAGHLGDIVISTGVLPVLRDAFPDAEIGFLTVTYSRAVVEGHPLIKHVHFLDHWRLARTNVSLISRMIAYYTSWPALIRELRAVKYDMSLDLRAWFPNYIPLVWLAGIPVRAGFNRVGFSPLLTHERAYVYRSRHELDQQLEILRCINLPAKSLALAAPVLAPITAEDRSFVEGVIGKGVRYRVLHPTASTPARDWPVERWIELARHLVDDGITPVITGAGQRDAAIAQAICENIQGAVNSVGKLSWLQLMAALEGAEVVYSVETSVGHIASALGRPVVAIYGGMSDVVHWAPLGSRIATHPMPCAPCYNQKGCSHRSCLVSLSVADVEAVARK